jgi:hypothetical protein
MHILNPVDDQYLLHGVFEKIYHKNAISLLGAGASVTNNQFLSKELISYYEGKIARSFGTDDIIKFVDMLQATPNLNRADFDRFVVEQIARLKPGPGHRIFVSIPWKQIITTNYDTLIEEASDDEIRNHNTHYKLHVIRNKQQIDYQQEDNELSYIKLNGCKTDLSLYPLVFSTDDFKRQASYYKKVLQGFRQFSSEIIFISFGYSFTDIFAESLLERIASSDVRQKKILYCVDPFINDNRLSYLASKQIAVIKMTFDEFFMAYKDWFEDNNKNYIRSLQKFTNPDASNIVIGVASRLALDSNIVQLKDDYRMPHRIKKIDFYSGEEPNYQVIVEDFDVIRVREQNSLLSEIKKSFAEHTRTAIPKFILIRGDFGTGKTTFTLRAIREYLRNTTDTLAFEITKPSGVKKGSVAKLIEESSATQFIFYCDNIETDSIFKGFNDLRIQLATEQYSNLKIIFISSIRGNILEKFKHHTRLNIVNLSEFNHNAQYSEDELIHLVENLKDVGMLNYRDVAERNAITQMIEREYRGDSFITLYKLIENGKHYKLLEKAFEELSQDVKIAFKITALVHKFNMLCPAAIIKEATKASDWSEFTDKVLKGDGKGILFQESRPSVRNEPDLFFKTKHPIIADALIKTFLRNAEKNMLYKSIFSSLSYSEFNAGFIIDLIKNIRLNDNDISQGQIDNYFELAKREFELSPHFVVGYITNIEKNTNSIQTLENCLDEVTLFEGTLEYRNHRLIHRKATICFKIARLLIRGSERNSALSYADDAEEWFDIKKHMDPLSSYSYLDYFSLLMWKLLNFSLEKEQLLKLHKSINTLFDEAYRILSGNTDALDKIFAEYSQTIGLGAVHSEYLEFLLNRYQEVEHRPSAAILLYYYYDFVKDEGKALQLLDELNRYKDNQDVVYFLFKYYGRNLHEPNNRIRLFDLISKNSFLIEASPLRFFYFRAVSEFYNLRWADGWNELQELKAEKFQSLNPDFFLYWKDSDGKEEVFEAEIIKERKVKKVRVTKPFYKAFYLVNGNYDAFKITQQVNVKLKFFLDGVKAEISN